MRVRVSSLKAIGRAVAFAFVAAAIVLAAIHARSDRARHEAAPPQASGRDPLAPALARCQALGAAAEQDATCQATWAENRRRFFNDQPASEGR
jgi:conjugative transfer region protein TrbK